jgi:small subunit ribosomal protein S11
VFVVVSDLVGRTVGSATGGSAGFKHRARVSPTAATDAGEAAARAAARRGHTVAHVVFKGPARTRPNVLRGIVASGLSVKDLRDATPTNLHGPRPPKARRL